MSWEEFKNSTGLFQIMVVFIVGTAAGAVFLAVCLLVWLISKVFT